MSKLLGEHGTIEPLCRLCAVYMTRRSLSPHGAAAVAAVAAAAAAAEVASNDRFACWEAMDTL